MVDDGPRTGTFDMTSGEGLEIELFTRTGNLIGRGGGTVTSVYNGLFESGDSERETVNVELGGGAFGCRITFNNWTGSSLTWGDGSGNSGADATGSNDPLEQMSVLKRYFSVGEYDSRGNAELEVLKWYDAGDYDRWDAVAFEEPSVTFSVDNPTRIQGTFTMFNSRRIDILGASEERTG